VPEADLIERRFEADGDSIRELGPQTPAELLAWRPANGVLSVYARIEPGDRGEGWRIEIGNAIAGALAAGAADRETGKALEATAERLRRGLRESAHGGEPRGLVGFVEVAPQVGEERWYALRTPPPRTEAVYGPLAHIHPLLEILDDAAPLGLAVISSERVRLLDWRLGAIEELHDWELEYFGEGWRERKAPRPRDPARGEGVSAAGRDRFERRLESNRERFAAQTGALTAIESRRRGWRQAVAYGDERYFRHFSRGFGDPQRLRHLDRADLIGESAAALELRIETLLPELNRDRERALIERIKGGAFGQARSSLGLQETLQALEEGRVEQLVYDADRDYGRSPGEPEQLGELPLIERMVELALSTGARVIPIEGESAEALEEQDGVIALLRY
jgi:hypothetical protein